MVTKKLYGKKSVKLRFNTVQFTLNNPTPNAVVFNLFDTNTLAQTPSANVVGAFPNALGSTISTTSTNTGIAYDSTNEQLWVSRPAASLINVYDKNNVLVGTITTGADSIDTMDYDSANDRIYAASNASSTIRVYNAATLIQTTTMTNGAAVGYNRVLVAENLNKIYAVDTASDTVDVYSAITNTFSSSIALGVGDGPQQLAYNPNNFKIYVTALFNGVSYSINGNTDTIVTAIATIAPTAVVYVSVTNEIWMFDSAGLAIRRINSTTDATIAVFGAFAATATQMQYSSLTNTVFLVLDTAIGTYLAINGSTLVTVATVSFGIAIGADTQFIYNEDKNFIYSTTNGGATIVQEFLAPTQFFISGSTDYNLYVEDTLTKPKKVDRIMIYSLDDAIVQNPLFITVEDANGQECNYSKLPNIKVAASQFFGAISQLNFKHLILYSGTDISYSIPAFTTLNWVVYYEDMRRSDLLSNKPAGIFDVSIYDPNEYSPEVLKKSKIRPAYEYAISTKEVVNLKN